MSTLVLTYNDKKSASFIAVTQLFMSKLSMIKVDYHFIYDVVLLRKFSTPDISMDGWLANIFANPILKKTPSDMFLT